MNLVANTLYFKSLLKVDLNNGWLSTTDRKMISDAAGQTLAFSMERNEEIRARIALNFNKN